MAGAELRGPDVAVTGVSVDTRTLRPGELFFAIEGRHFDGHRFLKEATAAGAAGVVVSNRDLGPIGSAVLLVDDTRAALLRLAAAYRKRFEPVVVGVTGSNGKTSTKEMLALLLSSGFRTVWAEGSYNNDVGVPLTVLRLDRSTEAAVFEVEMNEPGGTMRLARVFLPQVGVVTNIGDTHLEILKDRAGVAAEKAELLQSLPEGGTAVLNADDAQVMEIGRRHWSGRQLTFGLQTADVFATDIRDGGLDGVGFRLQGEFEVWLPAPGRHSVCNCLAACAAAHALGIDFAAMPAVLRSFRPPPLRLRVQRLHGVTLIDDCYNANPQSMAVALDLLGRNGQKGRRLAVLGDMLELGERSAELHRELGRQAVAAADRLLLVGREVIHTRETAVQAGFAPDLVRLSSDASEAAAVMFDMTRPRDTILVKGSRALGLELLSQKIRNHYEEDAD